MNRWLRTVLMVVAMLMPATAWAHAHLKRSDPAAGSRLAGTPQVIRLWFSERPELVATFASLTDSVGRTFLLGPAERDSSDQLEISFRVVRSLAPGRYTVAWRTAASDGHPTSGKFSFVVLPQSSQITTGAPVNSEFRSDSSDSALSSDGVLRNGSESNAEDADAAASISNSIARGLLFLGLLALIGSVTFRLLVLRGANGVAVEAKQRMGRTAARFGLIAAAMVIVVALVRLHLESQMMDAMPGMAGMQEMSVREMVMNTDWGFAFRIQIAAAFVALVGFVMADRRLRGGWGIAASAALVLAITPALGGHAAATSRFTSLMIAGDWLHVLGGGSWLGSLLCVMVIGVPVTMTFEPTERWSAVASLVNAFSPIALISAGVVVVSGLFASWVHLERISALWQTIYGRILLVKLLFVAITFVIGAYNFRKVQPTLSAELGTQRLRRSAAVELATGFVILLVTGLLTGVSP
jgi:copper transport protein